MIDGVGYSAVLSMLKWMLVCFHTGFLLGMISLTLAFNWNSDFINLILIIVGSRSLKKWEIVGVFFNQQCNLSAVFVEVYEGSCLSGLEKEFSVSLGAQLLSCISFSVPGDAHYICMRKEGKLFRFAAAHHFEWEVFSDGVWKTSVMCCYSLLMGYNNSTLCMWNCFDLNFLKCFMEWVNTKNLSRLVWQPSIQSLAMATCTCCSLTSNPLQLSCCPSWFMTISKPFSFILIFLIFPPAFLASAVSFSSKFMV